MKNEICFSIFILFLFACDKTGRAPEIIEHKCYPVMVLHNLGLNSTDEFLFDENNNLVDHYHNGYISEHLKFTYNLKQQICQSVYHLNDLREVTDTNNYIYSNDTLKRIETEHYVQNMTSPPQLGSKTIRFLDYQFNGDLIKITTNTDGQVQGYQEQRYEKNNLISIKSFDCNHTEIGNLGFVYNAKENSIGFTINGYSVEKIWFDEKNSPVKCLNLFGSKNVRIRFDNLMSQLIYTGSGYLLSGHNPVMIVQGADTVRYTYYYNEYDFPTMCYTSDSHNHQFSYKCIDN